MKHRQTRRGPQPPRGLDLVFGVHAVQALLEQGSTPKLLWVQEGHAEKRLHSLVETGLQAGATVEYLPREVLDAQVSGGTHQGIMAFCAPLVAESEESLLWRLEGWQQPEPPLLLVLDSVTDPHNFGACLRSADAAGVHGVIVAKDKSAPLNATVRKVACGAAESVPVYQITNLARTLARLKEAGVWILGAAGEAEQSIYAADLRVASALVMGAEGKGLRRLTREACDLLVKLPMAGSVSSLNVSVATGICLFEAVRQRQAMLSPANG